jgi:hypothetical protein
VSSAARAMAVSVLSGLKSDAARRWRRPGTATGPAVALTVPHFRIGGSAFAHANLAPERRARAETRASRLKRAGVAAGAVFFGVAEHSALPFAASRWCHFEDTAHHRSRGPTNSAKAPIPDARGVNGSEAATLSLKFRRC